MKNRKPYSSPESITIEIRQEGLLAQSEKVTVTFHFESYDDSWSPIKDDLNSAEYRCTLWGE